MSSSTYATVLTLALEPANITTPTQGGGYMASPGWYADSQDPSMLRMWDGHQWTDKVKPSTSVEAVDAGSSPRAIAGVLAALFALAALGSGVFSAWVGPKQDQACLGFGGEWECGGSWDVIGIAGVALFGVAALACLIVVVMGKR